MSTKNCRLRRNASTNCGRLDSWAMRKPWNFLTRLTMKSLRSGTNTCGWSRNLLRTVMPSHWKKVGLKIDQIYYKIEFNEFIFIITLCVYYQTSIFNFEAMLCFFLFLESIMQLRSVCYIHFIIWLLWWPLKSFVIFRLVMLHSCITLYLLYFIPTSSRPVGIHNFGVLPQWVTQHSIQV